MMKHPSIPKSLVYFSIIFAIGVFATLGAHGQNMPGAVPVRSLDLPAFVGYVEDEFIIVLEDTTAARARGNSASANALSIIPEFNALTAQFGVTRVRQQFPGMGTGPSALSTERVMARYFKVRFQGDLNAATAAFVNHPLVERVEPIGVHTVSASPNDTYYDNPPPTFQHDQWHYWDANGIDADQAWDLTTGDPNVVVGVLDTGVRYWHSDLGGPNGTWGPDNPQTNGNIWINLGEIAGNGIDDDGNGFIDDTVGYDFVAATNGPLVVCIDDDCGGADNDPRDDNGHGTHIAGTISAITNNARAVAGIAGGFGDGTTSSPGNGSKVMPLRIGWHASIFGQITGVVRMDYAAEAMAYVAQQVGQGVNVAAVNCSWGSSDTGGISAAVDNLLANDVMVIHAAGNSDADDPGFLGTKAGVMNVGATDKNGNAAGFTSFGNWVDLAAPGVEIMSTYHNPDDDANDYVAFMAGTSMATPHVCGVAALLESFDPTLTAADKFNIMVNTATPYGGTKDIGSGILNALNALAAVGPPCDVTADFTADIVSGCGPLTVSFTDLSSGPVVSWDWDFGDGSTSTLQDPSHEYVAPGTYTVTLMASSAACSDTQSKASYVTVNGPPTADFGASPVSGSAPLTVNFTDTSTENPSSWAWDFGDGSISVLQDPSHEYQNPGTYTVSFTATNSCGSDAVTKTDVIVVSEAPAGTVALALSDIPQSGVVNGSYVDTHASDDVYEVLTEEESGGRPSRRRSQMDHRWQFDVVGGASVMFYVEAFRPNNAEGDDFAFEWSTDNSNFSPLTTVASQTEMLQAAPLPDTVSGTVYVRALDTDRTQGNRTLDSLFIDYMYIESSGTANAAPTVAIVNPANNSSFTSGSLIGFAGTASDAEDGVLTASLSWVSDVDGVIGAGGNFSTTLSDGIHTITAMVADSGGVPASDSVVITVGSVPMLSVQIVTDKPSYVNREQVLIIVTVTDGVFPVAGASVDVRLTTPKGKLFGAVGTTDFFGNALFVHGVKTGRDGLGTHVLEATASFPGFIDGLGTTTFEVTN